MSNIQYKQEVRKFLIQAYLRTGLYSIATGTELNGSIDPIEHIAKGISYIEPIGNLENQTLYRNEFFFLFSSFLCDNRDRIKSMSENANLIERIKKLFEETLQKNQKFDRPSIMHYYAMALMAYCNNKDDMGKALECYKIAQSQVSTSKNKIGLIIL